MPVNKIFILCPILLLLAACTKPKPEDVLVQKISEDSLKLSDDAIKNLKLEKVENGDFPDQLSLMGKVSVPEDRIAVVPARVGGRIDAVYAASGEVVTPGQALASIFSADFIVAREEYVQTLKQIQENPTPEAKHLLELSKKKLDALGMSTLDVNNLGVKEQNTKGENLTVRAPRAGAILDKKAVIGTFVNQGDTLFTIGDLSKVWFAGDIYPEDLAKVHKNLEVVIEPGSGSASIHGKVSFISPVVDPSSRTIKIRALMENAGNQLRADMYIKGSLILSKRKALITPKSALVRLRDVMFVFKRLPGNIFKKIPVTIEGESSVVVAVSKGLDDGDIVVSEGGLLLDAALNGANP